MVSIKIKSIPIFSIYFLLTCSDMMANNLKILPFLPKQNPNRIRFQDSGSRYTYFQTQSGELQMTILEKIETLLKASEGTHYQVMTTEMSDRLLILKNEQQQKIHPLFRDYSLFAVTKGGNKPTYLEQVRHPKLHLKGLWFSYFHHAKGSMVFKSLIPPSEQFEILVIDEGSALFTPQALMISDIDVIYTTQDQKNTIKLFRRNRRLEQLISLYEPKKNELLKLLEGANYIAICSWHQGVLQFFWEKTPVGNLLPLQKWKVSFPSATPFIQAEILGEYLIFLGPEMGIYAINMETNSAPLKLDSKNYFFTLSSWGDQVIAQAQEESFLIRIEAGPPHD